jgi:hypothetical protein
MRRKQGHVCGEWYRYSFFPVIKKYIEVLMKGVPTPVSAGDKKRALAWAARRGKYTGKKQARKKKQEKKNSKKTEQKTKIKPNKRLDRRVIGEIECTRYTTFFSRRGNHIANTRHCE